MSLDVSGGAGGTGARYCDMLAQAGLLDEAGGFEVASVPEHDGAAPHDMADVFAQQRSLGSQDRQVQVVNIVDPDGARRYLVQVPGTQDWAPTRGDNLDAPARRSGWLPSPSQSRWRLWMIPVVTALS